MSKKSVVYQVYYHDYEGNSELLGTFGEIGKAKNKLREAAAEFQESCMEAPSRIEELAIYFDDPDGYDYWFEVLTEPVK